MRNTIFAVSWARQPDGRFKLTQIDTNVQEYVVYIVVIHVLYIVQVK